MKDQVEALLANGIEAAALNSAGDTMDNRMIRERCMHGEIKVIQQGESKTTSSLDGFAGPEDEFDAVKLLYKTKSARGLSLRQT